MRNVIRLKKASAIEPGEYVLTPQNGMGILLALKVAKNEAIDDGKRVELETGRTGDGQGKRLHVLDAEDLVAVVI